MLDFRRREEEKKGKSERREGGPVSLLTRLVVGCVLLCRYGNRDILCRGATAGGLGRVEMSSGTSNGPPDLNVEWELQKYLGFNKQASNG